jgi:hypothetical protein
MNHKTFWTMVLLLTTCGVADAGPLLLAIPALLSSMPAWVGAAMTVVGTLASVSSSRQQAKDAERVGQAEQAQSEVTAKNMEAEAGQRRAVSQHKAMEDRRQARLVASRAQVVAGGAGGDGTALDLMGDIAGEGEYNALTSLYEGEEGARSREYSAANARAYGASRVQAANMTANAHKSNATATLFKSATSLFDKYGQGGFGGGGGLDPMAAWRRSGSGGD